MPRRKKPIVEPETPWSRLPRESEEAFAAFIKYRNLGQSRSIDAVAASLRGHSDPDGRRAGGSLFKWSATHEWRERSRAWDNHLQARRDKALADNAAMWEVRRLQAIDESWETSQKLREKLKQMLAWPIAKTKIESGKTIIEPTKWNFGTVVLMAKLITELEVAVLTAIEVPMDKLTEAEVTAIKDASHEYLLSQLTADEAAKGLESA